MSIENTTPRRLIIKLVVYFAALILLMVSMIVVVPESLQYLPFGGTDALEGGGRVDIEITQSRLSTVAGDSRLEGTLPQAESVRRVLVFLAATLLFTLLVMLPVTWTYSAINFDRGPSKTFVRALMVLPITASTVVLLIQDSLALAFGLAALVAAVRFRVALNEAMDGIFIFAAICVGLAAGIGFLGVATVMCAFFCLTNAILWQLDYGRNPIDEARTLKKRAKLDQT